MLDHAAHSSHLVALAEYRSLILREVDGVALRVGRLLREAKQAAPSSFDEWVVNDLPFGLETARRLMAISAAYERLPHETLAQLPRPWQAMYALKALPVATLVQGIEDGEITPDMTVRAARDFARRRGRPWLLAERDGHRADVIAGSLMQFPASALTPTVRHALEGWLERATAPQST